MQNALDLCVASKARQYGKLKLLQRPSNLYSQSNLSAPSVIMMLWRSKKGYAQVNGPDVALEEEHPTGEMAAFRSDGSQRLQQGTILLLALSFIVGFVVAAIISPALYTWLGNGSYESGFGTEIGKSALLVKQKHSLTFLSLHFAQP
jgi:hypothetical protein